MTLFSKFNGAGLIVWKTKISWIASILLNKSRAFLLASFTKNVAKPWTPIMVKGLRDTFLPRRTFWFPKEVPFHSWLSTQLLSIRAGKVGTTGEAALVINFGYAKILGIATIFLNYPRASCLIMSTNYFTLWRASIFSWVSTLQNNAKNIS